MKINMRALAVAGAGLMALPLAACGGGSTSAGGDPGAGGKVVIVWLNMKEGDNNTGFDVEVARYVAKDLGYTDVELKGSPSAQRENMIQSDQVKIIFATYSITDDRKQKVLPRCRPYFIAGQDLLVKSDNTDITGPDSLNGKKLCSVTGSTSPRRSRTSSPTRSSCSSTRTSSASRR